MSSGWRASGPLNVAQTGGGGISVQLSIRNSHPSYARAYLREMVTEFKIRREEVKQISYGSAEKVLQDELAHLNEQIRAAEDDLIEFQRVNQMELTQAKGNLELGYLNELAARQQQLSTERWMLDVEFPRLKGQSPEMIRDAYNLTRTTGQMRAPAAGAPDVATLPVGSGPGPAAAKPETPAPAPVANTTGVAKELQSDNGDIRYDDGRGWQDVRVRMAHLQKQRRDLLAQSKPDHPRIQAIDDEIKGLQGQIELQAEVEFARLKERAAAIDLHMDALEDAQRRWKNSNLNPVASTRFSTVFSAPNHGSSVSRSCSTIVRLSLANLERRLSGLIRRTVRTFLVSVLAGSQTKSSPPGLRTR